MRRFLMAAFAVVAAFVAVPVAGGMSAQAATTDSVQARAADVLAKAATVKGEYTQYRRWRRHRGWGRPYYGRRFYGRRFYGRPYYRPYRPYYGPRYGFRPYY